jgi:hypothetical protein
MFVGLFALLPVLRSSDWRGFFVGLASHQGNLGVKHSG